MQNIVVPQKNQEIFSYITDLLATKEFRSAQADFFDLNCKKFDDSEENKHLYNDIFRAYSKILDEVIDSKLSEKYSESEIKNFYDHFSENHTLYKNKTIFTDTLETLFSFTDFDNFKSNMLEYNKQQNGQQSQQQKKQDEKVEAKLDAEFFNQIYKKPQSEWNNVLTGGQEDLNLYAMDYQGTPYTILKSVQIFKNVSVNAVIDVTFNTDYEEIKAKMPIVEEGLVVKRLSETEIITYLRFNFPVVGRRDQLLNVCLKKEGGYTMISQHSIELPEYPLKENITRGETHKNLYLRQIEGTNDLESIEIRVMPTFEHIPKMFINMLMAKTGRDNQKQLHGIFIQAQQALDAKKKQE